jgi:hypothetical protein
MRKNYSFVVYLIIAFALTVGIRELYFVYLQKKDKWDRPWAYKSEKGYSLTGTWVGDVTDAEGNRHHVSMEIINPYDDAYRRKRASDKRIKRDRSSKTYFMVKANELYNGLAIKHESSGRLSTALGNKLNLQFSPEDNRHYHGFNLNLAEGTWIQNQLTLNVHFAYFTKEGFSYSNSADPRHEFIGKMTLNKK